MVKSILVGQEPTLLQGIAQYLAKDERIQCFALCKDLQSAYSILEANDIDLIFYDTQGLNQMALLEQLCFLPNLPKVVLMGEKNNILSSKLIVGNITLPVLYEDFILVVEHALLKLGKTILPTNDSIFVKCDGKLEKILYSDLLYIESLHNYMAYYTKARRYIVYGTLKNTLFSLPRHLFVQTHKSYIVNKDYVGNYNNQFVQINGKEIPLGRNFKEDFKAKIMGIISY